MVPTSHFYTSQRLALHYLDWGNHSAPPLLLLHGVRDHARSWDWVAAQLSEHWHVIVPDLQGHGDSEWTSDGNYRTEDFIYDLHQMVTTLNLAPVTIISHSLGGHIALRYAGLYPDAMHKLVAIEGLGYSPKQLEERARITKADHLRQWLADKGNSETRTPKRYASFADAVERMHADNDYLSEAQVLHLTQHALRTNADGSFSWKFDNHLNVWTPVDLAAGDVHEIWAAITCPLLLCYGDKSWASNPERDGRLAHFNTATLETYAEGGHWLHHDQFDAFMASLKSFL